MKRRSLQVSVAAAKKAWRTRKRKVSREAKREQNRTKAEYPASGRRWKDLGFIAFNGDDPDR